MIISAEVISQPLSGEYEEVVYDFSSEWKSAYWGWIKFTDDDYSEWVGEFRGEVIGIEISERFNSVLVLTKDCLFLLDRSTNKVVEIVEDPEYVQIILSPQQEYIVASDYEIAVIRESAKKPYYINISGAISCIRFRGWKEDKLILNCEDYLEYGEEIDLSLDSETFEIDIA